MNREDRRAMRRRRARRKRIAGLVAGLAVFTAALTGAAALRSESRQEMPLEAPQTAVIAANEEALPEPETPQAEELCAEECPLEVNAFYDVPLDIDLQAYIVNEATAYGIDPAVILGMIDRESDFDPDDIGDGGEAYGLMQVQPKWHRERMARLYVDDLLNPYQNVTVGIDYLAELLDRYDGDMVRALTAYNRGPSGADLYYEEHGTYSSGYSREVLANREELTKCGQ